MKFIFACVVAGLILPAPLLADNASPGARATPPPVASMWERIEHLKAPAVVMQAACCKVCRKGQACGDSCISRSYTCHVGVGCACDG